MSALAQREKTSRAGLSASPAFLRSAEIFSSPSSFRYSSNFAGSIVIGESKLR